MQASKLANYLRYFIIHCIQKPKILMFSFLSSNIMTDTPIRRQPLLVIGYGKIEVCRDVVIGYFPSPLFLSTYAHLEARYPGSAIYIGSGTKISNNFSAIAEHTHITIGKNVLIGANVQIIDSDFHGLQVTNRHLSNPCQAKPVHIQDNVFIGSNVRILKGVTIGEGAVIANSSVVNKDIPKSFLAAGVPAKIVKSL